jgi:hypothetical protein
MASSSSSSSSAAAGGDAKVASFRVKVGSDVRALTQITL